MFTNTIKTAFMAGLVFSGNLVFAQETPATIPDTFLGTYELTYSHSSTGVTAPFENGSAVNVVLQSGNQICVNGTVLSNPVLRNGNGHEAIWVNSSNNQEFAFSSLITGFNEVNVMVNSTFAGQLRGSKSSDVTTCEAGSGSAGAITLTADASSVISLAEEIYGSLFGTGAVMGETKGYTYRFYPTSKIYVGFKDGRVYIVGGPFGDKILDKGPATGVITALNNAKIKLEASSNGNGSTTIEGSVEGTGGEWDLTISGTSSTFGFVVNIPSLVVNNITLDNPASQSEIEKLITDTYTDLGTISNLKVVIINNTSSHVQLDVSYSAVVQGVTSTYDMHYDFVK